MLGTTDTEVIQLDNSLEQRSPHCLPLECFKNSTVLLPGESTEVSVILHSESLGLHELCLLFVFRGVCHLHFSTCIQLIFHRMQQNRSLQRGSRCHIKLRAFSEFRPMQNRPVKNPTTFSNSLSLTCHQWRESISMILFA